MPFPAYALSWLSAYSYQLALLFDKYLLNEIIVLENLQKEK
jgi:hypothetical protein